MKHSRGRHSKAQLGRAKARNARRFTGKAICIACSLALILALVPALALAQSSANAGSQDQEASQALDEQAGSNKATTSNESEEAAADEGEKAALEEDHDWDEGVVTKEPTCTETGEKEYTCKKCANKKTDVIPALGHDWDEGVVTKEPTCTETGEKTYTCKKCCNTKTDVIPALGHDLAHFDRVEPTCTQPGNIEYWHCDKCGKYFSDEAATNEIDVSQTIIPKLSDNTNSSTSTSTTSSSSPKTGDNSTLALFGSLSALIGAAGVGIFMRRRSDR